jgi:hypothetical protein
MLWREKALILHVEDANLDYRDSTWLVQYLGVNGNGTWCCRDMTSHLLSLQSYPHMCHVYVLRRFCDWSTWLKETSVARLENFPQDLSSEIYSARTLRRSREVIAAYILI